MMNYQSTHTLSAGEGAIGTWEFDSTLIPHPIFLMALESQYTAGDGAHTVQQNFLNPQIAGTDVIDKCDSWFGDFQRWRLAYMSVTVYQDGPDLSNQGTVVVSQVPWKPEKWCISGFLPSLNDERGLMYVSKPGVGFTDEDKPVYEVSQSMPNAYFNKSKEGAYVPLKLTKTCQQWHSGSDSVVEAPVMTVQGRSYGVLPNGYTGKHYPFFTVHEHAAAGYTLFPTEVNPPDHTLASFDFEVEPVFEGTAIPDFCNDVAAHISVRNASVATSFSFFIRCGYECQCVPQSTLAPHLKLSPAYDGYALKSYFSIAREMKDAYPADYNDLGKIWDVISGAARLISPGLGAIPVVGPALSAAVPSILAIGDAIRRKAQKKNPRPVSSKTVATVLSQGDIDRARLRLAKPGTVAVRNKRVGRLRRR